jgi:hypothetical protein
MRITMGSHPTNAAKLSSDWGPPLTAEQLIEAGCDVFVVADATSSRTIANHGAALERMRAAGAQIVTTEMVAFEWLARAGTPEFKEISALIK